MSDPEPEQQTADPAAAANDNGPPTFQQQLWEQSYAESQAAIPEPEPTE